MAFVYPSAGFVLNGATWLAGTWKVALVDDTYTPDRDHVFMSSVGNSEVSVSGFSRGFNSNARKVLSSLTVVHDTTNNRLIYGAANSIWSLLPAGTAPAGFVVLKEGTNDSNSSLIAFIDPTAGVQGTGGNYTAVWSGGTLFDQTF